MEQLLPSEIADAAPRMLSPELHSELVATGKLEAPWANLLRTLRWKLGLNKDALVATLSQM